MKLAKYMRDRVWEYLLCVAMAVGLCINVFQGFFLPDSMQSNALYLTLFVMPALFVFFIAVYNKKTMVLSLAVFVAAAVFMLIYFRTSAIAEVLAEKTDLGAIPFFLIASILSFIIFLLTRTKPGAIIMAVLGAILINLIVFMKYEHYLWGYFLFIISSLAMCFYINYRRNALRISTVKVAFGRFSLTAGTLSVLILAIGVAVSVLVVEPLNLSTRELKLFKKYLSFETMEVTGISSRVILPDEQKISQNTDETIKTSRTPGEEDVERTEYQDVLPTVENRDTNTLNYSNLENFLYAVRYTIREAPPFLWFLLPLLLAVLLIGGKIAQRKLWYRKTLKKDKKQQIKDFYLYYLKKLEVLRYKRPVSDTPTEFARKISERLRSFANGEATIANLTEIFVKVNYGDLEVDTDEHTLFLMFHKKFYRNCRDKLGTLKYCLKFFAL